MRFEKSAGAVVFRRRGKKIEYLLLCHPSASKVRPHDIWDFPKGLVDLGEDDLKTAKREVEEETGLSDLEFLPGFKEKQELLFKWEGEWVKKKVVYFLAEAKSGKVKLSFEHTDYVWLPLEQAQEKLTFKNSRGLLGKAERFLREGKVQQQLL